MLEIARATLRARWSDFVGAFIALALGTTMIAMMTLALAATYTSPHPGVSTQDAADDLIGARSMAGTTVAIAVCVAVFIVIATFAFVVDQRSRELALLRLTGATPAQVMRMVLAEAALVGIVAAAAGCLLGPLPARWLQHWMIANDVAPAWFRIGMNPIALVAAFCVGTGAAIAGATAVGWRAARTRPVLALRDAEVSTRAMTPVRWVLALGLLVAAVAYGWSIAAGTPQIAVNPRKYGMVPLLYVGGLALLAPILVRPVARIATWPLSRFGAAALLVRQNTLNARRRTAATVTPVVVAVGLVAGLFGIQLNGDASTISLERATNHATAVIRPLGRSTLDAATVTAAATLPGAQVEPLTEVRIRIGTSEHHIVDTLTGKAVTQSAMGTMFTPRLVEGSLDHLGSNFIVVDQHIADSDDLRLGQALSVWLPDGTRTRLTIGAIIQAGLDGDDTYMSASHAGHAATSLIWLRLPGGTLPDSAARALTGHPATVQTAATYFDALAAKRRKDTATAAVVILGIALAYSLIAVANTLAMAAAGRRREFAALDLVGGVRSQVLAVVAAEAALAVVIGTIFAAAAGVAAVATQRLALRHLVAHVPVVVPLTRTWQAAALCAVVAIAAAAISTWRTSRQPAVAAIAGKQ